MLVCWIQYLSTTLGGLSIGLNALDDFGFDFHVNNCQIDAYCQWMQLIGVSSYYLIAKTMLLASEGLLSTGVALLGFVVGGMIVLSIGFDHMIQSIFGYWD